MPRPAPGLHTNSTIDSGGGLTTTLPRTGVDIGPTPDFWADRKKMDRYQDQRRDEEDDRQSRSGVQEEAMAAPSQPVLGQKAPVDDDGKEDWYGKWMQIGGGPGGWVAADAGDTGAVWRGRRSRRPQRGGK
jgi:hypothetical protein